MADRVSDYLAQWERERPDLDASSMGILGRMARVHELVSRSTRMFFATHDLQPGEFDVLATLRRAGDPYRLTPGELARSTMITNAAMTNRLARLEDKGLLARQTDRSNRRSVLVTLTSQGLAMVDELVVSHLENQRRILAPLSAAEQQQLAALLETFLEGAGDSSDRL